MTTKSKNMNIRVDENFENKLNQLAYITGYKKSEIIRKSVEKTHADFKKIAHKNTESEEAVAGLLNLFVVTR